MDQGDGKHESEHLEEWRARMASRQAGGLSEAAFCRKHELTNNQVRC